LTHFIKICLTLIYLSLLLIPFFAWRKVLVTLPNFQIFKMQDLFNKSREDIFTCSLLTIATNPSISPLWLVGSRYTSTKPIYDSTLGDLSLIQILEPFLCKQKGSRVSKMFQLIISEAMINRIDLMISNLCYAFGYGGFLTSDPL